MTLTPKLPPYDRLSQLAESIELAVGVSEFHGVICGLLCAGHADAHVRWIEELFAAYAPDDLLVREVRQSLGQLYQVTRNQISGEDLGFDPYLPDDRAPLSARLECMALWCQGYLYGLGLAGLSENEFAGDAREIIRDVSEITRMDYESIEEGEANEAAFRELAEFLKVGVLLIWQELTEYRDRTNDQK